MLHNLYSDGVKPVKKSEPCPERESVCRVFCRCKSLEGRKKKTLCLNTLPGGSCHDLTPSTLVKETKAVNDSVRPIHKLSKSRLYRTNSLARELRKLGVPFSFFGHDTIHLSLNVSDFAHTEVYVSATREQYTFKKQYFKFNSWQFDEVIESIDTTGKDLLSVLVYLGELPERFQPEGGAVIL